MFVVAIEGEFSLVDSPLEPGLETMGMDCTAQS